MNPVSCSRSRRSQPLLVCVQVLGSPCSPPDCLGGNQQQLWLQIKSPGLWPDLDWSLLSFSSVLGVFYSCASLRICSPTGVVDRGEQLSFSLSGHHLAFIAAGVHCHQTGKPSGTETSTQVKNFHFKFVKAAFRIRNGSKVPEMFELVNYRLLFWICR